MIDSEIDKAICDIDRMMEDVEAARAKLLKKLGWVLAHSTPGGLYLWRKKVKMGIMLVDWRTALDIEQWNAL